MKKEKESFDLLELAYFRVLEGAYWEKLTGGKLEEGREVPVNPR